MSYKKNLFATATLLFSTLTTSAFAADPHWTYEEEPTWGEIESLDLTALPPAKFPYAECSIGQKQSPVDIVPESASTVSRNAIKFGYGANPLSISNNGHTVKVNIATGGMSLSLEHFNLLQFHMHAPSEHTLNGQHYPLEIHFVHSTPDGKLAVVGVFAKIGTANPALQTVLDNAPDGLSTATPNNLTINPTDLLPATLTPITRAYYTYAGSLTTPPCTEGVNWYVLKTPIQISAAQLALYQAKYQSGADTAASNVGAPLPGSDGNRLTQPLNGRVLGK